jgi:hypothetical protein
MSILSRLTLDTSIQILGLLNDISEMSLFSDSIAYFYAKTEQSNNHIIQQGRKLHPKKTQASYHLENTCLPKKYQLHLWAYPKNNISHHHRDQDVNTYQITNPTFKNQI